MLEAPSVSEGAPALTLGAVINDRYNELPRYPQWSFYGEDYPTKQKLLTQRNRVVERHPKTTFVASVCLTGSPRRFTTTMPRASWA